MKTKKIRIGMLSTALFISCLVGSPNAIATTTAATLDQSATVIALDQSKSADVIDWPMQLFTPSESGVLTQLDLALGRDSDRVNSFHVDIFPVDRDGLPQSSPVYGNPDDLEPVQILATSVSELEPSSPDYLWTTIILERPIVLVGGQPYIIRIVAEDGAGTFRWYTSSSEYTRGGARTEDSGEIYPIYVDDSETTHLQYGFKTWMQPSVFVQSGVWQEGSIDRSSEFDCISSSGNCPTFNNLSTDANGSRVFGMTDSVTYALHSSDSGQSYSTPESPYPISNGGIYGTALYSNTNGEGVLLARFCNLWNSVDGGVSFSRITAVEFRPRDSACFKQVAATQDGQVMAAVASGATWAGMHQGVYVSTDAGVTWTETIYDQSWTSISMSGDGSKMIMASDDGFVRVSSDFGATWNYVVIGLNNSGRFNSVAMSLDGETAYLSDNHRLFKLNTSNGDVSNFGHEDVWRKIQISADGAIVAALDDSGSIFVSQDSGQTLVQAGDGSISFTDMALSSDGLLLHASSAGKMHRIVPSTVDPTPIVTEPSPEPSVAPSESEVIAPTSASSEPEAVTKVEAVKKRSIQFASSSITLSPKAKSAIRATVKKAGKNADYVVTGYAGESADVQTSQVKSLAKKRAAVVKAYLVKLGVKKSHIKIKIKIVKPGVIPKTKILAIYLKS